MTQTNANDEELDEILQKLFMKAFTEGKHAGIEGGMTATGNVTEAKAAIKSLLERRVNEARKNELKEANKWALGHNLNDASKHKWYRYYDGRLAELS